MIHWYAARFMLSNYDCYARVISMLFTLGWPTLEQRRNILMMMFKIVNNLVEVTTNNILFHLELRDTPKNSHI